MAKKNLSDTELSKTLSLALRHEPWMFELELDHEGWTDLAPLLAGLQALGPKWEGVDEARIAAMIERSEKKRHELREGRIRAFYGHSVPGLLARTPAEPPVHLFHGTSPQAAEIILEKGLKPMRRQFVHLSADLDTAHKVGQRKAPQPVILKVEAGNAHASGIRFYLGNELVWLADPIAGDFIGRHGDDQE